MDNEIYEIEHQSPDIVIMQNFYSIVIKVYNEAPFQKFLALVRSMGGNGGNVGNTAGNNTKNTEGNSENNATSTGVTEGTSDHKTSQNAQPAENPNTTNGVDRANRPENTVDQPCSNTGTDTSDVDESRPVQKPKKEKSFEFSYASEQSLQDFFIREHNIYFGTKRTISTIDGYTLIRIGTNHFVHEKVPKYFTREDVKLGSMSLSRVLPTDHIIREIFGEMVYNSMNEKSSKYCCDELFLKSDTSCIINGARYSIKRDIDRITVKKTPI